jgi:hypothetical protein
VVARGASLPLLINAQDASKEKDMEVEVTLTSSTGQVVYHDRSAATLNQQTSISLPAGLAADQYRMDIVIYSSGEVTQKKTSTFFIAADGWKIDGITSFPPLITTKASVMLKAELQYPAGADPWLRWSRKGAVIAKGSLSSGFDQTLWVAPSDEGVYSITLEMFPSAPQDGTDFPFTSSLLLSSEIFVANGQALAKGDLSPDTSYLLLLHLQGNLPDAGMGARRNGVTAAVPVGSPQVVSVDDGFGYRLDGNSGLQVPWLALPMDGGTLKPFTLSMGVSFDDPSTAGGILSAQAADGSFSLAVLMDAGKSGPDASLSATGVLAMDVPWNGPALAAGKRYLLSLSIVPQGTTMTAQWFLDGIQVSAATAQFAPTGLTQKGSMTIGGDKGFKGVVDELGVYATEPAGRPSTDPDQFLRAETAEYGTSLVLADGFDGTYLSCGFTLTGSGQVSAGTYTLKPGSTLGLPPVPMEGSRITVTVALASSSSRTATLQSQWDGGGSATGPVALTADAGILRFRISADGQFLLVDGGSGERSVPLGAAPAQGAKLLLTLGDPADARSPLVLDHVLAVKDK